MIEQGIQQLIATDQRFTSIASTRLYPVLLPTDSPLPAATYQVISVTPLYSLDTRVNLTKMRLQIDTWSSDYSDAKTLAAAIVSILDNFTGALPDGTSVLGIQARTSSDLFEPKALMYRTLLEFNIQFAT